MFLLETLSHTRLVNILNSPSFLQTPKFHYGIHRSSLYKAIYVSKSIFQKGLHSAFLFPGSDHTP